MLNSVSSLTLTNAAYAHLSREAVKFVELGTKEGMS